MTSIQETIVNNANTSDDILANLAEKAILCNDKELLYKIAIHPNAGPKTFLVIDYNEE